MFRYLPEQASELAPQVDWIHNLITDISVFFTVVIVGTMLYFAIRYRRRGGRDHETPQIRGNDFLEVLWTIIPSAISVFVLYWGIVVFKQMKAIPKDALEIQVRGQKWNWDFEYREGKKTSGEFFVPVDTPIKLVMKSRDVVHSFFIPEMRVKKDVLPNIYTYISFTPVKTGVYQSYCTEYCGDYHSNMLAKLKVVPKAEFKMWLADKSAEIMASRMSKAELGAQSFKNRGCVACHSLDGTPGVGPSLLKVLNRKGRLDTGKEYTADENYLARAILQSAAEVVEGFKEGQMPTFEGQINEDELESLLAFLKSLDEPPKASAPKPTAIPAEALAALSPAERGKNNYNTKLCVGCHSLDGSKLIGPSFKGLFGRKAKLDNGLEYEADEKYLRSSIANPGDQVVEGFQKGQMPQMPLSESEINDLIEFIKTVN